MMHYRIFLSVPGEFRDPSKYEFIAEFADQKAASHYVQYMGGKKRFLGKDIIIKAVGVDTYDPADGHVEAVISAIGEVLNVEEYDM